MGIAAGTSPYGCASASHLDRMSINARLNGVLGEGGPFAEVYRYILATPGKRVRAGLTLACSRLARHSAGSGVPPRDVLDLACVVEMLHEASLIHDDICDGSTRRRGMTSVPACYGVRFAAAAGLHLAGAALRLLADVFDRQPMASASATALRGAVGPQDLGELAFGQIIEGFPPPGDDVAALRRHYRAVTMAKTGTLFRVACAYGAALAGCDRDELHAVTTYADSFALAFQIMDDIHDLESQADAGRQIPTWPVIEWLAVRPGAAARWRAAGEGRASPAAICADIMASGALALACQEAAAQARTACAALAVLADTDGRRQLAEVCGAIVARP